MIRRLALAILSVPIAVVLIGFAIANRQSVTVSLDPFANLDPGYAITAPLYLLTFGALIAGVLIGGSAAWFEQGKWRRGRARLLAELREIKAQTAAMHRRDLHALPLATSAKHPPAA